MSYILIALVVYSSGFATSVSVEFETEKACEFARTRLSKQFERYPAAIFSFCAPKGETK